MTVCLLFVLTQKFGFGCFNNNFSCYGVRKCSVTIVAGVNALQQQLLMTALMQVMQGKPGTILVLQNIKRFNCISVFTNILCMVYLQFNLFRILYFFFNTGDASTNMAAILAIMAAGQLIFDFFVIVTIWFKASVDCDCEIPSILLK